MLQRGADYAHQIILAPPNFQPFRRPCFLEKVWASQLDLPEGSPGGGSIGWGSIGLGSIGRGSIGRALLAGLCKERYVLIAQSKIQINT